MLVFFKTKTVIFMNCYNINFSLFSKAYKKKLVDVHIKSSLQVQLILSSLRLKIVVS